MKTKPAKPTKGKRLTTIVNSPAPRPITITGYDGAGKTIASERASEHWKAKQIADSWRGMCSEVAITEK